MKKVIVLQPILAHYRRSIFELMEKWKGFDLKFIAGSDYLRIKTISVNNSKLLPYLKFSLFGHKFFYMKKSFRTLIYENPDIIISSGIDFHLLHTIIIFLYFRLIRRKDFFWWTHGTPGSQGKFGIYLRKFFYSKSTGILVYSENGKDTLRKWGIGHKRIKVVRNSLNIEDYGFLNYDLEKRIGKKKVFTIVFSGRVTKMRRLDILIHALHIYKTTYNRPFKLLIIGDGCIDYYMKLVSSLDLEKEVKFTAALYGKEAAQHLLEADLLVYPKAIGLSIVQAYSYGIPVITTDKLKIQMPEIELLVPGETGDFYQDENVNDLADKILNWHHILNESRSAVQKKCIDRIHELKYFPDQMAEQLLEFISR